MEDLDPQRITSHVDELLSKQKSDKLIVFGEAQGTGASSLFSRSTLQTCAISSCRKFNLSQSRKRAEVNEGKKNIDQFVSLSLGEFTSSSGKNSHLAVKIIVTN